MEVCSPYLYVSFGTFYAQIGQLFEAQWIFEKYFVVHEHLAVKLSFSTYLCYNPDGLFWMNLYELTFISFFEQGSISIKLWRERWYSMHF